MGLTDEQIIAVKVTAEDATGPGFSGAETKMGKLQNAASKLAGMLAGAGTATLVGALSDAARAGAEEQASLALLQTAIENSGQGWAENSTKVMDAIDAGKKLGFNNEDLADSMGLLVAQTGDVNDSIFRQKLAMDLARGAHIDLYTASKLLGKVTDDNVNVLSRYGIVVQKGATETELFGVIQAKFGDQAEKYGNTTAGAIDKTKVAIEDWQQAIGNSLGPAQAYIALLPGMSAGLTLAGSAATTVGSALTALTGVTLAAAAPFIAVAAAIALVGVALWQIGETVVFVHDNWDKFVYALVNGKLNDIPVFGFFFEKIQTLLGWIQSAIDAWNNFTSMFGSGPQLPPDAPQNQPDFTPPIIGAASGFSGIVSRPTMFLAGEGGSPERVNIGGTGSGPTIVVNIAGSVISENELVDVFNDRILGRLFSQRNLGF